MLFLLLTLWFPLDRLGADIAFGRSSAASEVLKHPQPGMTASDFVEYSNYEISYLRKAVALCPLEVKYQLYLGLAYEQRAQIDDEHAPDWNLGALECYLNASQMSPANSYYYNDQGRVYDRLGLKDPGYLEKAVEAYQSAVHFDPSSPLFNINWSFALQKLDKQAEAEEKLEKAFDLDPNFASKTLAEMAVEKYRQGDKKSAFQFLEEALHYNTSSAEAYYCRGILYLSEKQKGLALKDLEAAKRLSIYTKPDPNSPIQNLDEFINQAKR